MVLPTSRNPISFSQIEAEFGGNATNSFGGYRLGTPETIGGKTFNELDTDIPTSGTINYGSFSGKRVHVVVDCHSGSDENRINARTKYNSNNVDMVGETILNSPKAARNASDSSGHRICVRVNKSIGSEKTALDNVALRTGSWENGTPVTVDIGGSGKILGAGGDGGDGAAHDQTSGSGGDGTSGLGIEYNETNVFLENNALISSGYGGGGGGAGCKTETEEFMADESFRGQGGAGGGGAGLPNGTAGTAYVDGSVPPANGTLTEGGQGGWGENGGGDAGNETATDAIGGTGGNGGDAAAAAQVGGQGGASNTGRGSGSCEEGGTAGAAGNAGTAIRKANDETWYVLTNNLGGAVTGTQANTAAESGGDNITVS